MWLRAILPVLCGASCVLIAAGGCGAVDPEQPAPPDRAGVEMVQPLQDYLFSFREDTQTIGGKNTDLNPFRFYTHLGTDYGAHGTG